MSEYTVELQDANGTAYGTVYPFTDDTIYFDDIEEAKLYAKSQLNDEYVLARVIEEGRGRVVAFYRK